MINGITVLNEYKDMHNIATIILLILLLLAAITLFVLAVKYKEYALFLCSLIVCVFFILTIVFEKVSFKTPMIYEVTIDESVSFIEFTDRYEIIEQKYNVYVDDNVYVIKEK